MGFVLFLVMVFFVVLGIAQFLEMLSQWVQKPKKAVPWVLVVPLQGEVENMEQALRWCQARALRTGSCSRVAVVDMGLSKGSRSVCAALCRQNAGVSLVTPEQLSALLEEEVQK